MAKTRTVIISTYIVEDIRQSCNDLAVIQLGHVLFRGSPADLIGKARGGVWHILSDGPQPNGTLSIVSTLQLQNGGQYRVLGQPMDGCYAAPVEPGLEDGYMLLMQQSREQIGK